MPTSSSRKKTKVEFYAHPKFDRILRAIAVAYKASPNQEALAVPYIITCAAALEAKVNDALAQHVRAVWKDSGETILKSYMSMSFRAKLDVIPPLLTNDKFRWNESNEIVLRLYALISVRNLLVHPKPFMREFVLESIPHFLSPKFGVPAIDDEYLAVANDLSFGSTKQYKPEEFHEAIEKLEKWFFHRLPDRVSKIALLTANSAA